MDYVVRGGTATPDVLQKGYRQHQSMPQIYRLSVQSAAGQNKTLKELALAGHILNGQISYATLDELAAAVVPLGNIVRLIRSPGILYHAQGVVV